MAAVLEAFAQRAPAAGPQHAITRHVLAAVQDDTGRPIVDIDLDDFVVREDDEERDVLSIQLADYPIVVVIDNGRSADRDFDAVRRATRRFIERVGHRPLAVVSSDPPRVVATFDEERPRILDRIDRLRKGGSTDGVFPGVVTAAQTIQQTGALFSAIVAVVTNFGGTLPPDFPAPVLDSGASVHLVIQQKATGRATLAARQWADALTSLVDDTHGQVMTIYSPDSFQQALDREANQLATELMVEYVAPADSAPDSRVKIGVRLAGASVHFLGVARR